MRSVLARAFGYWCIFLLASRDYAIGGELIIPGTGDGLELLRDVAAVFSANNSDTKVIVPPSIGSGGGKIAVVQDRAVLGRVAIPLSAADEAVGIVAIPIVRVPTAFFTHAGVGIKNVTSKQIADVFAGTERSWAKVGGPDVRIRVIRREEADSTLQVLRATLPEWKTLTITDRSKTAVTTQEAFEMVAEFEGAVGFGPYSIGMEQQFNVLKVDGKHPTSNDYPSFTTIRLIFKRDHLTEEAKRFIQFASSAEAARVYIRYGGVPEDITRSPPQ